MSVLVRCWGDYACFTRPEMKAERVSYDVMTPSAARGILDSIYWHPGMTWIIDKIWVCKPIKFAGVRRNELKSLLNAEKMLTAIKTNGELPVCDTNEDRTQRASLILKDVEYVIQAHFEVDDSIIDANKVQAIVTRRLDAGSSYGNPYFGCREFPAYFERVLTEPDCSGVFSDTRDLGWMLWDMDYSDKNDPKPLFFRAEMINGCIEVPKRGQVS